MTGQNNKVTTITIPRMRDMG